MPRPRPPKVVPGEPISARTLNGLAEGAEALGVVRVEPPLTLSWQGGRPLLGRHDPGFWARITSGSNPYAYEEVRWNAATSTPTTVTGGRTGTTSARPAFEVNGITTLSAGAIEYLRPAGAGGYVFRSVRDGAATCSSGTLTVNVKCGGTNRSGVPVTITGPGGYSSSGTTDGSGNYAISLTGLEVGTYTGATTGTDWSIASGTASVTCGTHAINLTVVRKAVTISGTVEGCDVGEVGATVDVYDGATLLGSTTTTTGGAYSIAVNSANRPLTVKANASLYAEVTASYSNTCNSTATVNIGLLAATGYYCLGCVTGTRIPIPDTLFLTGPLGNCTLTRPTALPALWSGTTAPTMGAYSDCTTLTAATSQTVTINWGFGVGPGVDATTWRCKASVTGTNQGPISDTFAAAAPAQRQDLSLLSSSGPPSSCTLSPFSVTIPIAWTDPLTGPQTGNVTVTE